MDLELLETVADVFTALGDNPGVEALTGSKPSALSMWRAAGTIGNNHQYDMISPVRAYYSFGLRSKDSGSSLRSGVVSCVQYSADRSRARGRSTGKICGTFLRRNNLSKNNRKGRTEMSAA